MKSSNEVCRVYIGTSTNDSTSGIVTFSMDSAGRLEQTGLSEKLMNPSYLAVGRRSGFLYSVMETSTYQGASGGAVCAFLAEPETGDLRLINQQPVHSRGPCHLALNASGSHLFTANYVEGSLTVFPINQDGSVAPVSATFYHQGSGPNHERQEQSHMHYIALTPDDRYLFAVDLGTDTLWAYETDFQQGGLVYNSKLTLPVKPGSGPRHMLFHPDGAYAYVITELSSEIIALSYSHESGLTEIQSIFTLPAGYTGHNYCAAIHNSPDGRFLYASNRGHDSISVFDIDPATGKLEWLSACSTLGSYPRDFAIDPAGRFLIAANQFSNSIVPFAIHDSGKLEPIGAPCSVPSPVCVIIL